MVDYSGLQALAREAAEKQASEICKNCRWWKIRADRMKFQDVQDAGACQVNPPVAVGFPQTLESDRCSRFERRAEPTDPVMASEETKCVKAVYEAFTLTPEQSEKLLADMTKAARLEFIQVFSTWLFQRTNSRQPPETSEIADMAWVMATDGQARQTEKAAQSRGM